MHVATFPGERGPRQSLASAASLQQKDGSPGCLLPSPSKVPNAVWVGFHRLLWLCPHRGLLLHIAPVENTSLGMSALGSLVFPLVAQMQLPASNNSGGISWWDTHQCCWKWLGGEEQKAVALYLPLHRAVPCSGGACWGHLPTLQPL